MDGTYEPSFEVVDRAEEAEDYLLSKTRLKLEDSKENSMSGNEKMEPVPVNSEHAHRNDDGAVCEEVAENVNECDNLQLVIEEEEGQEALWVEETEVTGSSPRTTEKRRSSFLFVSKKHFVLSPKRSFSMRKKRQPQVILLGTSPDSVDSTPAPISTTEVPQPPEAVPASDTISSLGFDKSFDAKSPLSMSSLNEILDAPLTPTEASEGLITAVEPIEKKKKGRMRGMFQKKNRNSRQKSTKRALSLRLARSQDYDPTVLVLENVEDDEVYDPKLQSREVLATVDVNERIQMALLQAMENDDTQSLTSYTGVPVIANEDEKEQKPSIVLGQKPLNFDKVKPNFVVASKECLTLAEIQEKFVPLEDLESDDEAPEIPGEKSNLRDAGDIVNPDASEFCSPMSNSEQSAATDRYTVAGQFVTSPDSDCDDAASDKYSILPDPCSFCDSFYVSTSNPQIVSKTMTESPTSDFSKDDIDAQLDSAVQVVDKYAELPEVLAVSSSGTSSPDDCIPRSLYTESVDMASVTEETPVPYDEPRSSLKKSSVSSKRLAAGLFRKFRRPSSKADSLVQINQDDFPVKCSTDSSFPKAQVVVPEKTKNSPKKSILKKKKDSVVSTAEVDVNATIIVPPEVEKSGAKISVITTSNDAAPPSAEAKEIVQPLEDPSTEGSSSAEDESNLKAPTATDPLLVRLRKNLQQSRASANRRGLDPQTEVDPIIVAGGGRSRLDP